jgi:DNA-binding NtrC family response regulator
VSIVILVVEPEETLRLRVQNALREAGHRVWAFSRAQGAVEALEREEADPDLALLTAAEDPDMDRLIASLQNLDTRCQRVWIAPPGEEEVDRLAAARRPRGLLSRSRIDGEAVMLADRVWTSRERGKALVGAPVMIGESPAALEAKRLIDRIAETGAPTVLVTGESGTGKEVASRRIHALGPRAHGPFIEIDCASIPTNLMESELFGHEPGAFTDARETKVGLLELAQGGTAFLDEIGELDLGLQAKLLRVLDGRRVRRLGGRDEIPLDIHLIAATNRELEQEVRHARFRADLFYRLDVVRVALPPVRERGEDAWLMAQSFLEDAARRLGRRKIQLADALRREFLSYPWPGNVREIRNHMERLALLAPATDTVIRDAALPSARDRGRGRVRVDFSGGPLTWESVEQSVIREALRVARGNVSEAARLLGLGRGALRYRMARLGFDPAPAAEETAEREAA